MQHITRFALIASVAVIGACAPSTEAPLARFGGSFDPATGTLQIVALEGDDTDVEQALFQKVEVDANNGTPDDATSNTVEVRNATGNANRPTVTTIAGAGGDAAACGVGATDPALSFGLRIYNNVADFSRTVVRIDTVNGNVDRFCHLAGRTNAPGLQHPRLASYEFGPLVFDTTTPNNDLGTGVVGRRIIAHYTNGPAVFTFTGSVFADF